MFISACDAPRLRPSDHDSLGGGIRILRDLVAAKADGDRLVFMRMLIEIQTRALVLFRSGKEPVVGVPSYQSIGDLPVAHMSIGSGLETSGMRELAAGLGLIGREAAASGWSIDLAGTARGHRGALRVVTAAGENAVFFAANPKVGVDLEVSGVAPVHAQDVIVLYSTGPVARLPRSPHGRFGRTGRGSARHVNMSELLRNAQDLPDLEHRFRQEASL
jgi:hypothetical protein